MRAVCVCTAVMQFCRWSGCAHADTGEKQKIVYNIIISTILYLAAGTLLKFKPVRGVYIYIYVSVAGRDGDE